MNNVTWDIEVGACDFDNINPNPQHKTIFVEPVPYYASKLSDSFKDLGILKLDVEGHELEVLEGFDWLVKPEILKIEHKFVDLTTLLDILKSKGYNCWYDSEDVFGYLT